MNGNEMLSRFFINDDGSLYADPLTRPGAPPWDNLRRVIAPLLADPLLTPPTPSPGA